MSKHKYQSCTTCPNQQKCNALLTNTGKPISTANIVINNLVCRLQLGIERDKAAANLIQIFKPGMLRLLVHVKQTGEMHGTDMEHLLADMQSTCIEYLLFDYKIGDRGRATPYLFDPHQGFLVKWVKWITGKNRKFYSHHELYNPIRNTSGDDEDDGYNIQASAGDGASWDSILEGSDSLKYNQNLPDDPASGLSQEITDIIDDGMTLNSNEFRVTKYCMLNANESNETRFIDGLHIALGKIMCVSRPRITRLYARALEKIRRRHAEIKALEDK